MPQDIDLLQGSWSSKSLALEGHEMPAAMFANARMVVQRKRFNGLSMGTQYEGTLDLDASTNPHPI